MATRMTRTWTERARSMISHMNMNESWWTEVMNTASYNLDHLRVQQTKKQYMKKICMIQTEYHTFYCVRLSRVCACRQIGPDQIQKERSAKFFLGYSEHVKGYRIWIQKTKRIELTRS